MAVVHSAATSRVTFPLATGRDNEKADTLAVGVICAAFRDRPGPPPRGLALVR